MLFGGCDPGRRTGWAIVSAGGSVLAAATSADGEVPGYLAPALSLCVAVAVERPRAYPFGKHPAPAQDIVTLGVLTGKICERLRQLGTRVEEYEPRQWKGTLDKRRHHAQVMRDLPAQALALWHNTSEHARDAIALALYVRKYHAT